MRVARMMHLLSLLFCALLCQVTGLETIFGLYGEMVAIPCKTEANIQDDFILIKWIYYKDQQEVNLLVKKQKEEANVTAVGEYKDRVSMAANLSLLLADAKLTDQRTFKCMVVVGGDIKQHIVNLEIQKLPEAPFITEKAEALEIGKRTKLGTCFAKHANPAAKIVWLKNNKTLLSDGNRILINETVVKQPETQLSNVASTLHYSAEKKDTSAQFSCRAEHPLGVDLVSPPETFSITYSTENIALQVEDEDQLVEGSNMTLKCVADGNPPPTSFYFLLKGHMVKVENTNMYTIQDISRNNSGEYKCSLIDDPSKEGSRNVTVNFLDVKLNLDKTVIREAGGSLNISLDIDSSAKPTVSWTKGGVKLNQGPKNTNLAYSDAGFYELEVMLGPLRRKASFHLTVQGAPVIRNLHEQHDKDGNRKVLICEAEGSPKPAVSWNINGTLIDEKSFDNGTVTHKISVVPSANLSVTCIVSNSFGIATKVIDVSSLFEDVKVDKRDPAGDDDKTKLVVGVVVGLLVAAVVIGVAYWVYMKKSKQGSWKTGEKENGSSEEEKKLEEKAEENSQKADV
ncbi:PREDICTED: CD166 antigen isoform X1 [Cyprinodon variegatus]|uniref:Activated leukocyte cell adhesion molecule b n=1 Tax=Cyprinodon variegatus TaxID=28743 RepID=A0A3Q2CL60_CYPVA|nr:PREDICTED: CD166 antigen isoform X1 [Cyprinodon variegatus]